MPASAPKKTRDDRFGYEAAGDAALPPLVFLHGIGGAARAWRGQLAADSMQEHQRLQGRISGGLITETAIAGFRGRRSGHA